jgi:glycosyltransferase involved in cell wall biosynthesis
MNTLSSLISIVIPVYNGEKYVVECLDSIVGQSYRPLEIIIVDDGSTDNSAKIAINHHAAPSVLKMPHANLPSARNAGIRSARGTYVAFCDVDDLWHPEKLAVQAKVLEEYPDIGFVFTAVAVFGTDPAKAKVRRPTRRELAFNRGDQFALLTERSIIAPSSVLVRKSALDKAGLFDENLESCEDWDLWLRTAEAGIHMHRINTPLTLYRRHQDNMSKKIEVMHRSRLLVLEKAFSGLPENAKTLSLKNRALAMAHFEAANSYYSAGNSQKFNECYNEARRYGPARLSPKALRRRFGEIFHGR